MDFLDASFWVYLSTFIFLLIVIFKSYGLISNYLEKQQEEIRSRLKEAEEIYLKAQKLYTQYKEKLDDIHKESNQILGQAEKVAKEIIDGSQGAVDKLVAKKTKEAETRMADYEAKLINQIISKYSTLIQDDMKKRDVNDGGLFFDLNALKQAEL